MLITEFSRCRKLFLLKKEVQRFLCHRSTRTFAMPWRRLEFRTVDYFFVLRRSSAAQQTSKQYTYRHRPATTTHQTSNCRDTDTDTYTALVPHSPAFRARSRAGAPCLFRGRRGGEGSQSLGPVAARTRLRMFPGVVGFPQRSQASVGDIPFSACAP